MALAFLFWGKWLLNWPIIYGGLIVFGPPPPFGGKPPLQKENRKTPLSGGESCSNHHAKKLERRNFPQYAFGYFFHLILPIPNVFLGKRRKDMRTKIVENIVAIMVYCEIVRNDAQRRIMIDTMENA